MIARAAVAAAAAVLVSGGVACSASDAPDTGASNTTTAPVPLSTTTTTVRPKESDVRIEITIGSERFAATLDDSTASRDLLAQLPLTVEMSDHGGVEKTGPLPASLSLDGQPAGADPAIGDVGYYAPGNDLVLYYGDQSYYDGIVVLGRLEGAAPERISRMPGGVTVSVARLDG